MKSFLQRRFNDRAEAAVNEAQGRDIQNIRADTDTSTTTNALVGVYLDERVSGVNLIAIEGAAEAGLVYTVLGAVVLKGTR